MATEDEILEKQLSADHKRKLVTVLENTEYTSTVLFAIEAWFRKEGGADNVRAAAVVEKAGLQLLEQEADS
jgi:hypothetical protein